MTTGWSGSSKRDSLRVAGGLTLLALCAVDAGMQILALVAPHPFRGIGLLAIPFLPVILAYHASLLVAIFAGIPLAIACFWLRGSARVAIGVALIALTAANIVPIIREQEESRIATRVAEGRNAAFVAEVEKCAAVMAQRAREATTYFSEPRKVVAIGGPYAVEFENGMRIHLPAIHPPQPFHHFFYDYLTGSQVRVALRPPSAELLTAWCRLAGAAVPTGYSQAYEGDVYLTDRKIDARRTWI